MASLLAEINSMNQSQANSALSDGSDFDLDVGEFSDSDDYTLTLDERRFVDAIDREINHIERMEVIGGDGTESDDDSIVQAPTVDLNAPTQWIADPNGFVPQEQLQCTLNGGAAVQHPEDAQPSQYFNLFWTDEWWNHLVMETKRYANVQGPPEKWLPVTVADVKAFMGLILAMGILSTGVLTDYWRTSKRLFQTQFGKVMPRDRFLMIWRYLHLADNAAPQAGNPDRLAKLRPMITHFNEVFNKNYTPYRDVSIDESMVKFKGRLAFRQYMPGKPIKWGVKVWALSESTTGYMSCFQVYTGREAGQEQGLAHRVVKDLVAPFHHTGMRVYMDNFYTGVPLLRDLSALGLGACGTVRSNRKFLPADLLPKKVQLQKHQYKTAQAGHLTFSVWLDTKAVCVLSNFHDPAQTGTVSRRSGLQEQQQIVVPLALADYQSHMMGVDLTDQMIGYYMPNHRSRKWWRRIFTYLTMVSVHNAYVVAKDSNYEFTKKNWPNFKAFIEDLADELTFGVKANRDPPLYHAPRPGKEHHRLVKRRDRLSKVCIECKAKGIKQKVTVYNCIIYDLPIHVKCLQDYQQRMLRM